MEELAIHPTSKTHSQLSEEGQLVAGATPGYVLLFVSIELIEDVMADFEQDRAVA